LGGLTLGLISATKHTFISAIQIGSLGSQPVEPLQTTVTKLDKLYIPTIQVAINSPVGIKVTVPKDTQLILLESTVTEDKIEAVRTLHTAVGKQLIEAHTKLLIQQISALKSLADNYQTLLKDLHNNNYFGALGENVVDLKDKIARGNNSNDLQERLKLELKFAHSELAREQQQIKLASIDTQTKLDQLRIQIASAQNTSLVSTASEYARTGKSPSTLGVVGLILGVILGIFIAFLAEFMLRVKAAQSTGNRSI